MTYFANAVGAAVTDVEALPWIPFLPYSEELKLKIIQLNPVNGEWVSLLRVPAGMEMPKHYHSGTVHVYTISGSWGYKEHDWTAGPGSFVFETAASAHTPVAKPSEDVIVLNIVMGDWNIVDENDAVLAIENWKTMLKRYDDYCAASGIAPVDITSFAGN
jgi:2,4'-dihydroxyacetophenone dioxygenase